MIDLLNRNGMVITPDETRVRDIAIVDEKISSVGECGSFTKRCAGVRCSRKIRTPGLIDPHVHMAHPFKNQISADDFYTTTVSAAHGGTTSILDFAI